MESSSIWRINSIQVHREWDQDVGLNKSTHRGKGGHVFVAAGPRRSDVKEQEENVKDEEILRVQWKSVVQQAKIDMMQVSAYLSHQPLMRYIRAHRLSTPAGLQQTVSGPIPETDGPILASALHAGHETGIDKRQEESIQASDARPQGGKS